MKTFFYFGLVQWRHSPKRINRTCKETNSKRFKGAYYASPTTVHDIFLDIQSPDLSDKRIKQPKPTHLLLALRFLKKYPTKEDLAGDRKDCTAPCLEVCWSYSSSQGKKQWDLQWIICGYCWWYPFSHLGTKKISFDEMVIPEVQEGRTYIRNCSCCSTQRRRTILRLRSSLRLQW